MMILLFICLLIYFGVWLTLKISSNYNVFLSCRQLYNILLWGVYIMACIGFSLCLVNYQNVTRNTFSVEKVGNGRLFLAAYASLPFSVYIFKGFQQKEFHDSSHIKNIEKYTLYLRSFKDDKVRTKEEKRLMDSLRKYLYVPFAVGRPNEMTPSSHSTPLYIGSDWKQKVMEMMQKAPLILLRVSDTEHFLWELGTCITENHLHKSLFWVTDEKAYSVFRQHCSDKYGSQLPEEHTISKNCIIFLSGSEFRIFHLGSKKSYKAFCGVLFDKFDLHTDDYLYKRNDYLGLFVRLHYDKNISQGVQVGLGSLLIS